MKPELKETFYPNGNVRFQSWNLNGKGHNEEGPAYIGYYENGNVWYQKWFLNGKQLLKRDFTSLDMIKRMDAFELFSALEIARLKI
jgi:antitoxin component YwqK of YwqJK toxin-antitoxin module